MLCFNCDEEILPHEYAGSNVHKECLVRMVFGSAEHITHECCCYNAYGITHDAPGGTIRECARRAERALEVVRKRVRRAQWN